MVDALLDEPGRGGAEELPKLAAALGGIVLVHQDDLDRLRAGVRAAGDDLLWSMPLSEVAAHADDAGHKTMGKAVGGAHVALERRALLYPRVLVQVEQHGDSLAV